MAWSRSLRDREIALMGKSFVLNRPVRDFPHFHVVDDVGCLEGFADSYFDWVQLDASHEYAYTKKEFAVLKRKVRRSGLVAGDDRQPDLIHAHHGLCRAVRECCRTWGWEVVHSDSYGQ